MLKPMSSKGFNTTCKININRFLRVVLFIMLYKVVLTFDNVGKVHKCDHSITEEILSFTFE